MITFMHPLQSPFRYKALSTDEKPTDATYGSMLLEEDTGVWHIFYGGVWSVASTSSFDPSSGTLTVYHDVGEGEDWGEDVKSVVIADSVRTIGAGAFTSLENLEYVSIPAGVEVEDGAFSQTFKDPFDADIAMADVAGYEYAAYDGVMYQCDPSLFTYSTADTSITGLTDSGAKHLVFPSEHNGHTIINVGYQAIASKTALETAIFLPGSGVTTFSNGVFKGCTALTHAILPKSIQTFGVDAFQNCSSLVSIDLPEGMTAMGASCFLGCTSLESVSLPGSMTEMGNYAFNGCTALKAITFPARMSTIGLNSLTNCSSLTTVVIPSTITEVKNDAFRGCTGVTSVTFGDGFSATLGSNCFVSWTFYGSDGTTVLNKNIPANLAGKTFKGSASRLVEDAGPVPGMEGRYMYAITTDSAGMNILSVQAAHDGRPLDTVVTASTRRQGAENIPEEWDFVNGVGPFKCWYGAFNISDYVAGTESEEPVCTGAGTLAYRLDPYDLGTTMAGTTLQGTYNVFLVVPTVYWKAVGNILYLSDDSSYAGITGMTAYAHTATLPDTTQSVYPFIGIGVYEASSSGSVLMSASGKAPVVNLYHDEFKLLADALTPAEGSDFQQWNFFQWTLFKMMVYTVMGTKNSQWMLGNGPVNNSSASVTGQADQAGPYAQSTSQYDKVFIENSWGSVWGLVGDTRVNEYQLYAGQSLGGANTASGTQPAVQDVTMPSSSGWVSAAYSRADVWDLVQEYTSTSNESDPQAQGDYYWQASGERPFMVGARWSNGVRGGIAAIGVDSTIDAHRDYVGARLSAFFDGTAMGTSEVTPKAAPAPTRSTEEDLPDLERDEPAEEPVAEEPAEESAEPAVEEGTMDL